MGGHDDPWEVVRSVDAPLTDGADEVAPSDAAAEPDLHGERYERRAVVARGGMGQVDVVRDRWLGRDVARKVVLEDRPDDRLVREAEITARLDHPNIVKVLDTGLGPDGRRYYTMQLARGASLASLLATAELDQRLLHVPALLAVARAVEYAHQAGVVHRDLKPDNVTVGQFGEVQVIDWGIAAPTGTSGRAEGTPPYADPDQLDGHDVAPTHDVHALGRCLDHLLRGDLPRPERDPPAGAPAELLAMVDKATRPPGQGRYPSASAFADDLQAWLAGRRVSAHAYTARDHLQRALRAYRRPLAVGAVALLIIAGVSAWTLVRTRAERDRALAAESVASERLAALLVEQAVTAFEEGRLPEAERAAARARTHRDDPLARGLLSAERRSRATLLSQEPLPCEQPQLLPDGRVACLGQDTVRILAGTPLSEQTTLHSPQAEQVLVVGDTLVTERVVLHEGRQLDLAFFDADGTRARSRALPMARMAAGPHGLLVHHLEGRRVSADGSSEQVWSPCPPTEPPVARPAWTDDGHAAWACEHHLAWGEPVQRHPVQEGVAALAPHDGDLLVTFYDGTLARIGPDGERWRVPVPGGTSTQLVVAGRRVALAPDRGGVALFDARNGHGMGTLPTVGRPQLALIQDELVVLSDQIRRWSLPAPSLPHLLPMPGGVTSVDFSTDGALAVGASDHVVLVEPRGTRLDLHQGPDCTPVKDVAWLGEQVLRSCATVSRPLALLDRSGAPRELGRPLAAPRVATGPGWGVATTYGTSHWWVDPVAGDIERGLAPSAWLDLESDGTSAWGLGDDEHLRVLVRDGASPPGLSVPGARALALGPSDQGFLLAGRHEIWRVHPDGREAWRHRLPARPTDVAWSPRGDLVAAGTLSGRTWVLRASTGALVAELPGHGERVAAVSFSADGSVLVTGGWDQAVRRWSTDAMLQPPDLATVEARYGWGGR